MANNFYTLEELRMLPTKVLVALKRVTEKELDSDSARLGAVTSQFNKVAGITTAKDQRNGGLVARPSSTPPSRKDAKMQSSTRAMDGTSAILKELSNRGSNPFSNMTVNQRDLASVLEKLEGDSKKHTPPATEDQTGVQNAKLGRLQDKISSLRPEVEAGRHLLTLLTHLLTRRAMKQETAPAINLEALPDDVGITSETAREFLNATFVSPQIQGTDSLLDTLSQLIEDLNPDVGPTKIDLVYGPPKSVKGQFVLAKDGLYYNSRDGATLPETTGSNWAPSSIISGKGAANIGGRGIHYSEKDLDALQGTRFDIDNIPTDNLQYDQLLTMDTILTSLEDEKQKQIYDTSAEISQLLAGGNAATGALVQNHYLTLNAHLASYNTSIKKRKKQLELALYTGSFKIKNGTLIHVENGEENTVTHVPINDFSFLRGTRVEYTLEDQVNLTLTRGDVMDVVLPIQAKYLETFPKNVFVFDRFSIPKQGKGGFPHREDAGNSVSGSQPWIRNLTDSVTTDSLEIGYAFINPVVHTASSTLSNVDNFAVDGDAVDASLVGSDSMAVFPSGLGIPKFTGTQFSKGQSYCSVPPAPVINDLFYSEKGFSISWWQWMPEISAGNMFASDHKFRVVFANENCGDGGQTTNTKEVKAVTNPPDRKVKGLIMGWREGATANVPKFIFKIACSQNEKNSLWQPSVCFSEDINRNELGIEFEQPDADFALSLSAGYHHMTVALDTPRDKWSLYYDGKLMQTSGIHTTFGTKILKTPTFVTPPSHSLALSSYQPLENTGPKVDPKLLFTPYIIGGGFTDGITTNGFMGSNKNSYHHAESSVQDAGAGTAAAQSGFAGHIGLFTMYSKPLNSKEVKRNYELSKHFFTNISIS